MKLLAIDTATESCSAALWLDGPAAWREARRERGHAELILPMVEELLLENGLTLQELDAIAFGRGPGAFTGVRLAVSLAQGLAWSARLRLIAISDLRAVAAQMPTASDDTQRCLVCMDARMQEVYCACFERRGDTVQLIDEECVTSPSAVQLPPGWSAADVWGAGSGFAAYASAFSRSVPGLSRIDATALPHAREIARLAAADGLRHAIDAEDAHPVYLRDDVARVPQPVAGSLPSST